MHNVIFPFVCLLIWDEVSYVLGCPQTHKPSVSAYNVLRIQSCPVMPGYVSSFWQLFLSSLLLQCTVSLLQRKVDGGLTSLQWSTDRQSGHNQEEEWSRMELRNKTTTTNSQGGVAQAALRGFCHLNAGIIAMGHHAWLKIVNSVMCIFPEFKTQWWYSQWLCEPWVLSSPIGLQGGLPQG